MSFLCPRIGKTRKSCSLKNSFAVVALVAIALAACSTAANDQAERPSTVASPTSTGEDQTQPADDLNTPQPTTAPAANTDTQDPAETPRSPLATAVPAYPDVVVSTVAGGQIDFGSLEGQDTVLWFWAPW